MSIAPRPELPTLHFASPAEWVSWLEQSHAASAGIWMRIAKKGSGIPSVSYAEAVEVALCFGWIDGQKNRLDDQAWLQKFTPRGARSVWSRINRDRAEELIRRGEMRPAGLAAVERAKANGQWDAAYAPPSTAEIPDDLAAALEQHPQARALWETLNRRNRYAILFRIQTAKRPETRARRIQDFVTRLERGEKPYP